MASNIHLKITGPALAGESTDANHTGEIELITFAHGVQRGTGPRTTAGSGATGHSNHSDLSFVKYVDKATPELQKAICGGQQFAEMKIVVEKTNATGRSFIVHTLQRDHLDGSAPVFKWTRHGRTANYDKIKWEYTD
jgi:type VI secretion system secreted protein Hcp